MTLEEVSQAFEVWRSSKGNLQSSIPESLWGQVKLLQPEYGRSKICKALRISYEQFNKHCRAASRQDKALGAQECFIESSLSFGPPTLCELTLQGAHRTLTLKVPNTQLSYILPMLEAYL